MNTLAISPPLISCLVKVEYSVWYHHLFIYSLQKKNYFHQGKWQYCCIFPSVTLSVRILYPFIPLLAAAPCPPASIQVKVRRLTVMEVAMVSWSAVECPEVEYLVMLSGQIEGDPLAGIEVSSYWTDRTYFEFPLPCGTSYSIQVTAQNSAGTSDPSETTTGTTGT